MARFKIGESYHHMFSDSRGHRTGGGQLYTIVGMNKQFLFLSYGARYASHNPSDLFVISIEEAKRNVKR